MELTLAEELLLLLLDDEKGSSKPSRTYRGLAGALLAELRRRDALHVVGKKIKPAPDAALQHPVLAGVHGVLAGSQQARSVSYWVRRLPRELNPIVETVARPLIERGVLDERRKKFLGLFPSTRYPAIDPAPERRLRERLRGPLLEGGEASEREALLIGLLLSLGVLAELVPRSQHSAAKERAKRVASSDQTVNAVRDAVQQDIMTAVVPAVAGAAAAGTDGGGGGGAS